MCLKTNDEALHYVIFSVILLTTVILYDQLWCKSTPELCVYMCHWNKSVFVTQQVLRAVLPSSEIKSFSVGRTLVLHRRTFGRGRSLKHPTLRHSAWFSFGYHTTKNNHHTVNFKGRNRTRFDTAATVQTECNNRLSFFIDNSNNRRRFKAGLLDSVRRPVEAYLVHNSMSEALKTSLLVERIQEPC
jgi:hypothetical protein